MKNTETLYVIKKNGKFYSGGNYSTVYGDSNSWSWALVDAIKFESKDQARCKAEDTGGSIKDIKVTYNII